jgi:chromosomal replication initiator protein
MPLSAKDAWKRILDEAHRELPDHTIRTWLEPTEAIALDEGRLIVGAPDQFAVEWNETKHATLLSKLAEPVIGQPTSVVFRVHEDRQKRPQMDFFVAPTAPAVVITPVNPSPTSSRPRRRTRRRSLPARPTTRFSFTAPPAWARRT